MKRLVRMLKKVKIVFCKSNTLTKTVVLSAIALSMAALLALNLTISIAEARTDELTDQAAQLEQENKQLEENISDLGSADSVGKIAEDELGLVDPDTVVIEPEE